MSRWKRLGPKARLNRAFAKVANEVSTVLRPKFWFAWIGLFYDKALSRHIMTQDNRIWLLMSRRLSGEATPAEVE